MLKQSDVQGRMRLLRYGLIVVVVVTFVATLLAPYAFISNYKDDTGAKLSDSDNFNANIGDFLVPALIATAVALVLSLVIYFGYGYMLERTIATKKEEVAAAPAPKEGAG